MTLNTLCSQISIIQQHLSSLSAAPFEEGELILKLTYGSQEKTHRYRIKDQQLRIDQPGDLIP